MTRASDRLMNGWDEYDRQYVTVLCGWWLLGGSIITMVLWIMALVTWKIDWLAYGFEPIGITLLCSAILYLVVWACQPKIRRSTNTCKSEKMLDARSERSWR